MQETDGEGVPDVFERLEEQAVIAPNGGGGSGGDEFSTWNPSGVKSAPSDPTEPKPLVLIWIVVFQACAGTDLLKYQSQGLSAGGIFGVNVR